MTEYTAAEAVQQTGITYRQLDYWTTQGYVTTETSPVVGTGYHRTYTDDDIRLLKTAKRIVDFGCKPPLIQHLFKKRPKPDHTILITDNTLRTLAPHEPLDPRALTTTTLVIPPEQDTEQ